MNLSRATVTRLSLGFVLPLTALGCGSEASSASSHGAGVADGQGNPSFSRSDNNGGSSGGGDVTPASACVTSSANSALVPAYLVFMMDRSCSMSENGKWTSSAQALDAFFAESSTSGLSASLDFFPRIADSCALSDYAAPTVLMQPLPAGPAFSSVINASPLVCGTPTLPALQGALAYAQTVASQHVGSKVAVVLVTDGLPDTCSSSVASVAASAAAAATTFPTYVIGVGDALADLDAVASAGGTGKAILVSTASPQQVTQDLTTALGKVKANALSCEYTLPAPPAGQVLEPGKVNVVYTPKGGAATSIAFDGTCAGGVGWHYDNANAPTKIVMCPSTCSTLEGDSTGGVQILFGCATSAKVK
jgi:hypothetical protein